MVYNSVSSEECIDLNNLLRTAKEIDVDLILNKICVSRPYFNFDKILVSGDYMLAPIQAEQPLCNEMCNISSAEALRYIAILGSCQYGLNQGEKMFYLAKSARGFMNINYGNFNDLFVVTKLNADSKREMSQLGGLYSISKGAIHKTEVSYMKLNQRSFNSLFSNYKLDYIKQETSPYKELLNVDIEFQDDKSVKAKIPRIELSKCSGHFDNYAAIPVAYLAYNVIKLASSLITEPLKMKSFTASFPFLGNPNIESFINIEIKENLIHCTVIQTTNVIFELQFYI